MTPIVRPGRAGVVVLLAAAVAVGCSKPPRPKTTAKEVAAGEPPPAAPAGDPKADAAAFARSFLKAVHDGTATPAMLTPEFKKVIAEPVFPSDEARGYSDDAAEQWLRRFKGRLPDTAVNPPVLGSGPGAPGFTGGYGGTPPVGWALRVVRAGGGWQADWFSAVTGVGEAQNYQPGGPAGFAGVAFLQALVGKEDRLAEGLMTPGSKGTLAPPLPSDKRGYNRGILGSKLAEFRGPFTGYHVTRVEGDTVTAELTKADGKKPVTLKLAKGDRPWDWQVDDVKMD